LLSFRNGPAKEYLIVGLGNPGSSYDKTRHNIGFRAVRHFAKKHGIGLHLEKRLAAELGRGSVEGKKVAVMLPLTYMNRSGMAVKKGVDVFKTPLQHLLVVVDDVALPLGALRLRKEGSSGGHNGLKSIEEHVGTREYARLRLGVGNSPEMPLADYVLGKFEPAEEALLPEIFEKSATMLDGWIQDKES
jgi:peptidyl-tRNA hydrolase, PTH1 family